MLNKIRQPDFAQTYNSDPHHPAFHFDVIFRLLTDRLPEMVEN